MISGPSGATFKYDGKGRLVEKAKGGVTVKYLWDGDELVGEYSRALEAESRPGGANLDYHEIRQIAQEIKNGAY